MSHYAKVEVGIVTNVIVAEQDYIDTQEGTWVQTSYNTRGGTHSSGDNSKALRGNYAGIGYTWDEDNNIFYGKKPYASWVLNTTTASWHSPIGDAPDDLTDEEKAAMTHYVWNEGTGAWDKTTL